MADDSRTELHRLLGLGRHTSAEELKYHYEQAMAAATRSGNLKHAMTLLAAYEALSASRRDQIFGRQTSTAARAPLQGFATPVPGASRPVQATMSSRKRKTRIRPQTGWRQRVAAGRATLYLGAVFVVAAVVFVHGIYATPRAGSGNLFVAAPRPSATASVNASAIADDLDRSSDHSDISCAAQSPSTPLRLTCRSQDGETWSVTVNDPPDQFTASITAPSVYEQAAHRDAQIAFDDVDACRKQGGSLPPSFTAAALHTEVPCAGGIMTVYFEEGDVVQYNRTGASTFTIQVTAADGEIATYDSVSNAFSPLN